MTADTSPDDRKTKRIELLHSQGGQRVFVEPEDEDRFVITVQDAIKACRAYGRAADFQAQFKVLNNVLVKWIADRNDKIDHAYLTERDAGLLFVVVQKSEQIDPDFEDELTDLDLQIAHDSFLPMIKLSVIALPKCSKEQLGSFTGAWAIDYVERSGTH